MEGACGPAGGDDSLQAGRAEAVHLEEAHANRALLHPIAIAAPIDIYRADFEAEVLGLVDDDFGGIEAHRLVRHDGGEELGGMVGFEVGGLVGDDGERGGVSLAEPVGGEGRELAEGLFGGRLVDAAVSASREEDVADLLHLVGRPIVGHGAPQRVGLPEGESGERAGHLQDLLLIEDDAVGFLKGRLHGRMEKLDRLFVVAAGEVGPNHVGLHGTGTEERDVGDDVIEAGGLEAREEAAHAGAFELEDADSAGGAEECEGLFVIEREVVEVGGPPLGFAEKVKSLLDGREIAKAQQVHLDEAERLDIVLVELADDYSFGGDFEGCEIGDGLAGDDDSAEVYAEVAGEAVDGLADIEQLLERGGVEAGSLQLGESGDGLANAARGDVGYGFADAVDEGFGEADRFADLANGGASVVGVDSGDHAGVLDTVAVHDVVDHFVAPAGIEVDVDIGQAAAVGI